MDMSVYSEDGIQHDFLVCSLAHLADAHSAIGTGAIT